MPTTLKALETEVLGLPPADRSHLLDRLIDSLDDDDETADEVWDREAARRDAEIENGTSIPVDGKEVVARLKAQIR
ncbi:MAG: addiction module protein [Pseudomonadota bacterium]